MTQRNQIGQNKLSLEVFASAFVLISAVLPFLNNICGYLFDVNRQLENNVGERKLDLDSAIYFLSISSCFILLALGGLFRANRNTFYAALVAGYFHFITYVKFIFFNKNDITAIADMAIILILIFIVYVVFKLDNHYRHLSLLNSFNNNTLERFSSILFKRNEKNENE
ncbi:hypothetical protein [Chryseobacterium nematophagum]|uniref:hypothetical protein n=1 Tax=Chryseobacterium nematophagum TaxID=2305228 RepID=UPI0011C499A7|nr:hypothetical protein [Chryseobacterium nematophagum]